MASPAPAAGDTATAALELGAVAARPAVASLAQHGATAVGAARPSAASLRAQFGIVVVVNAARPAVASLRAQLGLAAVGAAARPASLRAQRAAALSLAVDPSTGAVLDPVTPGVGLEPPSSDGGAASAPSGGASRHAARPPAPPVLRAPLRFIPADELLRVRDASTVASPPTRATRDGEAAWVHDGSAPRGREPPGGEGQPGSLWGLDPTGYIFSVCERAVDVGSCIFIFFCFVAPLALFAASLSRITMGSCTLQGGVPPAITILMALASGFASILFWGAVIAGSPSMDDLTCASGLVALVFCFVLIAPGVALGLANSYHCDPGTIAIAATLVGSIYGPPLALAVCGCFVWGVSLAFEASNGLSAPPEVTVEQQLDAAARAAALPYHTVEPQPPSGRVANALVLRFSAALCGGKPRACTECAICSEAFNEGEGVACLSCGGDLTLVRAHVFHQECLAEWFRRHKNCPLCRAELPSAEAAKVVGWRAPGGVGPPPVASEAVGPAASRATWPASSAGYRYPFF